MSGVLTIVRGHLGSDPKVHNRTEDGVFVSCSIATNTGRKDKGGNEVTEWNTVRFNGKTGKAIAEHAIKGTLLYIVGELRTEDFVDKNGKRHINKVIYGREFEFLGPKKRENVLPPPPEDTQDEEYHQSAPSQDVAAPMPPSQEPPAF